MAGFSGLFKEFGLTNRCQLPKSIHRFCQFIVFTMSVTVRVPMLEVSKGKRNRFVNWFFRLEFGRVDVFPTLLMTKPMRINLAHRSSYSLGKEGTQ